MCESGPLGTSHMPREHLAGNWLGGQKRSEDPLQEGARPIDPCQPSKGSENLQDMRAGESEASPLKTQAGHTVRKWASIAMMIVGSLGMVAAGQGRRYDYETQRQFEAQEKHLDAVDRTAQQNLKDEQADVKEINKRLEDILIRIYGDERLVQGGFGVIMFFLTSGALVWFIRLFLSSNSTRGPRE
jgi:hypothetical protein